MGDARTKSGRSSRASVAARLQMKGQKNSFHTSDPAFLPVMHVATTNARLANPDAYVVGPIQFRYGSVFKGDISNSPEDK